MKDISDVKVKTMSGDKDRRECVSVSTFKGKTIEMPLKDNALFARYIRSYIQNDDLEMTLFSCRLYFMTDL